MDTDKPYLVFILDTSLTTLAWLMFWVLAIRDDMVSCSHMGPLFNESLHFNYFLNMSVSVLDSFQKIDTVG